MIQNMSVYTCPNCGHSEHIFGSEGVSKKCKELGLRLLGDIPLHARICDDADRGKPTVVAEPDSERAKSFNEIATTLRAAIRL